MIIRYQSISLFFYFCVHGNGINRVKLEWYNNIKKARAQPDSLKTRVATVPLDTVESIAWPGNVAQEWAQYLLFPMGPEAPG